MAAPAPEADNAEQRTWRSGNIEVAALGSASVAHHVAISTVACQDFGELPGTASRCDRHADHDRERRKTQPQAEPFDLAALARRIH